MLINGLNCYPTFIPGPEPFLLKSIYLNLLIKRPLQLEGETLTLNVNYINARKIVKWNTFHSAGPLQRESKGQCLFQQTQWKQFLYWYTLIFILGADKELGCFHDLLREDKRGNGRVNQKTSGFKLPVTPCESLTLFCFKNMLGIHLIFFMAHPLPCKPSIVHG